MNRTTRTVVVVSIALITAALASFGVYVAVRNIPVREVEVSSMSVAVAAQSLPMGTRIGPEHIKLVKWPASSPVPNSFSSSDPVLNRGLIAAISENEPFTDGKLAPIEAGAGLVPIIPEGMRAISVKVDDVVSVAGYVQPGTRVDVVVTLRQIGNTNREPMSRTVVSNVLVLTSGTRIDQSQARDGQPVSSTVVTLAVTPEDGERIALAANEGKISLALRNPLDTAPTETRGVGVVQLMQGGAPAPVEQPAPRRAPVSRQAPVAAAPAPVPVPVAPAPPPVYRVETIRAAKRTEEVVD